MKKIHSILSLFFIMLIVLFLSCEKPETYPIIPSIQFKAMYAYDTTDALGNDGIIPTLVFTFIDGDGDIGIKEEETRDSSSIFSDSIYSNNLFLTIYDKIDGEFQPIELIDYSFDYRIPYIVREGNNKTLKGEIWVELLPLYYDTVKIEFYILDRALHQSNVETTPEVILN
ncbi:MAG: hypothetical protein HY738_16780 [Bacteroidia bacterium]|nr:hypothetical protein [Bacteroidia bacterium]